MRNKRTRMKRQQNGIYGNRSLHRFSSSLARRDRQADGTDKGKQRSKERERKATPLGRDSRLVQLTSIAIHCRFALHYSLSLESLGLLAKANCFHITFTALFQHRQYNLVLQMSNIFAFYSIFLIIVLSLYLYRLYFRISDI